MAIRPLPGELLEHLPRGIDQSQISHHVPLRGGPDGLLGETHLLLFHGELIVLTRGSARAAYRRLDLDPEERAMLLAESWSVQLSLPTRGAPTCFEVSSKDVATVLALISAVKPGQHSPEVDVDVEESEEGASEVDQDPVAAAPEPVAAAERPAAAPRKASPAAEPASAAPTKTRAQTQAQAPTVEPAPVIAPPQTPVAPEPWRPSTNLRDAFAASEKAERHAAALAAAEAEARALPSTEALEPRTAPVDDLDGSSADNDDLDGLDDLNIDLSEEMAPRSGAIASSVRDIAASFRGAAASLRSAASSLRRGRDEPELGDLPPVDFDDVEPPSDEESLAIDIDEAFADAELPAQHAAPAPTIEPAAVASVRTEPARPAPRPPVASRPLRPAATARVTTPPPRSDSSSRAAIRFNFDDLPSPEAVGDGTAAHPGDAHHTEDVSLAEFFDRHVPPTREEAPARRRRRMVPEASARRAAPKHEVITAPQPPVGPTGTPVAPGITRPPPTPVAPSAPVSATPSATPSSRTSQTSPPKPAPVVAAAPPEEPDEEFDGLDEVNEAPPPRAKPRPNRRLDPRWSKGARRSATAAASAASTAATVTATAASAAVGRARVAANRLLDRRRSRSGRPRANRRRLGASGGRPTMAIAAALMTVAVLIYWALPGDVASVDTAARASESGGVTAPLAEMASEIKASQASMVPAAIGSEAPLPGSDEADEAEAETEPEPAVAADRDFYGVATLTPESPQPELLALKECRPLAERGLLVRVKVEIDEPTGTVPEVWVGDSSMERSLRQCVNRQFKKATFVPKERGKLIKQRLKLHF